VRRFAIVLSLLAALVLLLVVIGHAYTQGNETATPTGGASTAGCCVCASAYASTDDEHVNVIRQFRDRYLATNPVGRGVIVLYYDVVSPPLASFINEHPSVKPLARAALAPVVSLSTVALDTSTREKAAIGGVLALLSSGVFLWIRRRSYRRRARSA
jgi:hypothetical protein